MCRTENNRKLSKEVVDTKTEGTWKSARRETDNAISIEEISESSNLRKILRIEQNKHYKLNTTHIVCLEQNILTVIKRLAGEKKRYKITLNEILICHRKIEVQSNKSNQIEYALHLEYII